MLLKKVDPNWYPSENPRLQVGETVDLTSYETLVRAGIAVCVDEAGNEMELPNQPLTCPICFQVPLGIYNFVTHVGSHSPAKKEIEAVQGSAAEKIAKKMEAEEEKSEAPVEAEPAKKKMTKEELSEFRRQNIARARAARKQ